LGFLNDSFQKTLEFFKKKDITSVFILAEPVNRWAKSIVSLLSENVTGLIRLEVDPKKDSERLIEGKIRIIPNIGHPEGEFESEYRIIPRKGISVDLSQLKSKFQKKKPVQREIESLLSEDNMGELEQKVEIHTVRTSELKSRNEFDKISNVYELEDFKLIINNQIAFFNETNQSFNLLAFKIDPILHAKGLLTVKQLQNTIITDIILPIANPEISQFPGLFEYRRRT